MLLRCLVALAAASLLLMAQESYPPHPDSQVQPNVPQGKLTKYSWTSKIFPGTTRDYWVYVPAQYKSDKPAPVIIWQDGGTDINPNGDFKAPIVMDNLIAKGDMPAAVSIFIDPGVLKASSDAQQDRFNRSFEYDAVSDRYARFLIDEILPEVGKTVNLSSDPNDRALAGVSSGGIAAFTAAWYRPDQFRRVMSFIGSFTNLRGGDVFANWVRKNEPKPLRVFLQDGSNDNDIYSGSWWDANQALAHSLEWAGYDVKFVKGEGQHNRKHGGAILPDALRWLWRDYGKPIEARYGSNPRQTVKQLLGDNSKWELVSEGHGFTEGPAADSQGNFFFTVPRESKIFKVTPDGKVSVWKENTGFADGMMFGPGDVLYACLAQKRAVVKYDAQGNETVLASDVDVNDLAVTSKGEVYFTDPKAKRVWFINAKGEKRVVSEGVLEFANGPVLSPDESLLIVADTRGKYVWSFQRAEDGSLINGQPFYRMEMPDDLTWSYADGVAMDNEGWLYVATRLGIQVCDPPGRVNAIISKPSNANIASIEIGGPGNKWLYVTAGDKIYRRPIQREGAHAWKVVKPAKPRL